MPTERLPDPEPHTGWKHKKKPPCYAPGHSPPAHQVFEPGRYRHTCPSCGAVVYFTVRPTDQVMEDNDAD